MDIGTKIRKMREAKGLSQENMATELDMTQTGYGKIERNEVNLKYSSLVRISEILETSIENIIGYDDKIIFSNNYQKIYQQINTPNLQTNGLEVKELYDKNTKLLEDKIKLLEEKVAYLEDRIKALSKN